MCRSHADGGRLCPSQSNPVAIANRNARRRAKYAKTQVSGQINYTNLNETSYSDFGFQSPDEMRKSDVGILDLKELSETELASIPLGEQKALAYFTGDNYAWVNTALFGKNDYYSNLPPLRESEDDSNKIIKHFSDVPYSDYNKLGPKQETLDEEITPELLKAVTSKMDAAMAKAPGKQRILYRGVSKTHRTFANYNSVADYVKENYPLGQEVKFDGYQSTSYSPVVADNYADRGNGIVFEIKTPSGLNVANISQFIGEKEVLLPRNAKYAVVGVHENVTYRAQANGDTQFEPSSNTTVIQLIEIANENSIRTSNNFSMPPELSKNQLRTRNIED